MYTLSEKICIFSHRYAISDLHQSVQLVFLWLAEYVDLWSLCHTNSFSRPIDLEMRLVLPCLLFPLIKSPMSYPSYIYQLCVRQSLRAIDLPTLCWAVIEAIELVVWCWSLQNKFHSPACKFLLRMLIHVKHLIPTFPARTPITLNDIWQSTMVWSCFIQRNFTAHWCSYIAGFPDFLHSLYTLSRCGPPWKSKIYSYLIHIMTYLPSTNYDTMMKIT